MTAVENDRTRKKLFRDGGVANPEPASDQSTVQNVLGLLQDYVPQAVSGSKEVEKRERVLWATFETGDVNDMTLPHMASESQGVGQGEGSTTPPLLLTLGFCNGYSMWMIPPDGDACELFSCCGDEETARTVRLLKSPETGRGVAPDAHADKRPIIAVVKCGRSSDSAAPYSTLHMISLRAAQETWGKPFKKCSFKLRPIMDVQCNRRIVAVVLQKRIVVLDAGSLEYRFIIKNDYPSATFPCNPTALGTRWLAYSETKLSSKHQSVGGMSHSTTSSVATTMLKSVKKGISAISETISGLTTKAQGTGPVEVYDRTHENMHVSYANIITVLDTAQSFPEKFELKLQDVDRDSAAVVAHFVAHAGPDVHIAALQFNPSGNLLLSASTEGHTFHVFQLLPHPLLSSETAVHHLYSLYRGATYGVVQDIAFSLDSRWVVVSTLNGTSHAFPITPYGGEPTIRTHTSSKVVNRMSRFHTSAGIDSILNLPHSHSSGSNSKTTVSQSHAQAPPPLSPSQLTSLSFMGSVNGYNTWNNPRTLPLPNPISTSALQQIKQPYLSLQAVTGMSGKFTSSGGGVRGGTSGGAGSVRGGGGGAGAGGTKGGTGLAAVMSTESDISLAGADGVCVCAVFGCGEPQQNSMSGGEESGASYSLYIVGGNGMLVKHHLQPRKLESAPEGDDAPIMLDHHSQICWRLMGNPPAVTPGYTPLPLGKDHPLIKANDAYLKNVSNTGEQQNSKQPDLSSAVPQGDDKWLSQVEILTHAPPSRRLWMGPQFSFKTCHHSCFSSQSVSAQSSNMPPCSSSSSSSAACPIKTPSPPNTIIYSGSLNSSSLPVHSAPLVSTRPTGLLDTNAMEYTAVLVPSADSPLVDLSEPLDFQSLNLRSFDTHPLSTSSAGHGFDTLVMVQESHDTGMLEVCGSWNKLAPTFEGSPSFTGEVEKQLQDAMGEVDCHNVTVASTRIRTGFSPPQNN